jgi:recombination protein RecR
MNKLPPSITKIIEIFEHLPGVGRKTATRYAFWLVKQPKTFQQECIHAIENLAQSVQICKNCHNTTDQELCDICKDAKRNTAIICIVETPEDIQYIEKIGTYNGLYHVLGGTIDPLRGVQPEDVNVDDIVHRITKDSIKEVIIATNPTLQGDTTAAYIRKLLQNTQIIITMLGRGLTTGAHIEYVDEKSLKEAFQNRK